MLVCVQHRIVQFNLFKELASFSIKLALALGLGGKQKHGSLNVPSFNRQSKQPTNLLSMEVSTYISK